MAKQKYTPKPKPKTKPALPTPSPAFYALKAHHLGLDAPIHTPQTAVRDAIDVLDGIIVLAHKKGRVFVEDDKGVLCALPDEGVVRELEGLVARWAGEEGRGEGSVHLVYEPFGMTILAASLEHAQALLVAASDAGFRESGLLDDGSNKDSTTDANDDSNDTKDSHMPRVLIRSAGLVFRTLLAVREEGKGPALVTSAPGVGLLGRAAEQHAVEGKRRRELFVDAVRFRLGQSGV